MRFTYSPDIETKICTHEDSMFEVFSALVETYRSKFDKYGCDIRLEQYWYNNGHVSLKRLPFSNGYTCAFSCSAEKMANLYVLMLLKAIHLRLVGQYHLLQGNGP